MRLIWTKANNPLSHLIRFVTGDDCSHFAFVFENGNRKGTAYESNLLGTHPAFLKTKLKSSVIVHEKDIALTIEQEDAVWDMVQDKYDGKPYDFCGALYLGWRKILNRLFNAPLPEVNKWARADHFFCDEIYEILNHVEGIPKLNGGASMKTPCDVWKNLRGFAE